MQEVNICVLKGGAGHSVSAAIQGTSAGQLNRPGRAWEIQLFVYLFNDLNKPNESIEELHNFIIYADASFILVISSLLAMGYRF